MHRLAIGEDVILVVCWLASLGTKLNRCVKAATPPGVLTIAIRLKEHFIIAKERICKALRMDSFTRSN
jgi:hypothetical protein